MTDAAAILRRLETLKTDRATVEDTWRECYRYTYPLLGVQFETTATDGTANAATARQLQASLFDATATDAARVLASALMSGLTPANSRWFALDIDGAGDAEKRWLEASADTVWENIHQSNYDAAGFDCALDAVIAGTFALFVEEAEGGGYRFEQWPLASTYYASTRPGQPVDTVMNEVALSAEQIVAEYGEAMAPEKVREALSRDKPDERFTVIRAIFPRKESGRMARNMPIASLHIDKDSKHILRESGYSEMPIGVPRWKPVPGSAYAFGPVFDCLPTIKTLNKTVEYVLSNADLAIAGMWGAVDDGVLNARTIKIGPRKVVVMGERDNLFPLTPGGKFDVAALEIDRMQREIRRVLMADQLTPQEGPQMTATEVTVRVELIRQILGPIYGRLQSEFLQWLVTRCFSIAYRAGVLGKAPDSLLGREFSVSYLSPIARAQKAQDVAAMDRFEMAMLQESQVRPDILDLYDFDAAGRKRAELLGVPLDVIREEDDVKALRAEKARGAQEQQAMQMAAQAAGGMK